MWFDETVYLDEHNLCTAFFAIAWNVRSASPVIWLPSAPMATDLTSCPLSLDLRKITYCTVPAADRPFPAAGGVAS